eukprot:403345791
MGACAGKSTVVKPLTTYELQEIEQLNNQPLQPIYLKQQKALPILENDAIQVIQIDQKSLYSQQLRQLKQQKGDKTLQLGINDPTHLTFNNKNSKANVSVFTTSGGTKVIGHNPINKFVQNEQYAIVPKLNDHNQVQMRIAKISDDKKNQNKIYYVTANTGSDLLTR